MTLWLAAVCMPSEILACCHVPVVNNSVRKVSCFKRGYGDLISTSLPATQYMIPTSNGLGHFVPLSNSRVLGLFLLESLSTRNHGTPTD